MGGCATPNSQSFIRSFAKGFLRGASGASSSQRNNLPLQWGFCVAAVPHPIRKNTFVSAKVCVHVTLFHRETVCVKQIANSGFGSRGDAPCGG
ncbi:MAG: hypothetical protein IKM64_07595, partial [Clostridia bacterium]|nr:hypothetical protein [Clostridia bacterium]